MNQISREALLSLLDDSPGRLTLVEALPAAHYDAEHIPGAVSLPEVTAEAAGSLLPDRLSTVVTYCSGPSCGRSKAAAHALQRLSYKDVRVYVAGKSDWAAAGLRF